MGSCLGRTSLSARVKLAGTAKKGKKSIRFSFAGVLPLAEDAVVGPLMGTARLSAQERSATSEKNLLGYRLKLKAKITPIVTFDWIGDCPGPRCLKARVSNIKIAAKLEYEIPGPNPTLGKLGVRKFKPLDLARGGKNCRRKCCRGRGVVDEKRKIKVLQGEHAFLITVHVSYSWSYEVKTHPAKRKKAKEGGKGG